MKKKNRQVKRIIFGAICLTLSVVIMLSFTLAYFTDYDVSKSAAFMGSVNIKTKEVTVDNYQIVNPGDGDGSSDSAINGGAGGTSVGILDNGEGPIIKNGDTVKNTLTHELNFEIENKGNKSVRLRNTIILSMIASNGDLLPASMFAIVPMDVTPGSAFAEPLPAGWDCEYYDESGTKLTGKKPTDGDVISLAKKVKYIIPDEAVLDGFGNGLEYEEVQADGTILIKDGYQNPADRTYTLSGVQLAVSAKADNDFQNAKIHLDVLTEAIQYANTSRDIWKDATLFESKYIDGTFTFDVVEKSPTHIDYTPKYTLDTSTLSTADATATFLALVNIPDNVVKVTGSINLQIPSNFGNAASPIADNVTIIGDGTAKLVLTGQGMFANNVNGLIMKDLVIDSTGSQYGVRFVNVNVDVAGSNNNLILDNVEVIGATRAPFSFDGVKNLKLINCKGNAPGTYWGSVQVRECSNVEINNQTSNRPVVVNNKPFPPAILDFTPDNTVYIKGTGNISSADAYRYDIDPAGTNEMTIYVNGVKK